MVLQIATRHIWVKGVSTVEKDFRYYWCRYCYGDDAWNPGYLSVPVGPDGLEWRHFRPAIEPL